MTKEKLLTLAAGILILCCAAVPWAVGAWTIAKWALS